MAKTDEDEKQLIFTVSFINKETGAGINSDIMCPAGMNKPKDLAKFLAPAIEKVLKERCKPQIIEQLMNRH